MVGRLEPGEVVWANQQKGCMLRVVRMDRWGNIRKDRCLKPESWGWVSMRRKDGKPQLELITQPMQKPVESSQNGEIFLSIGFRLCIKGRPYITSYSSRFKVLGESFFF